MAFAHSPKIVTDGMVFYYDTGNSKSYIGEPTENLISPEGFDFSVMSIYGDLGLSQIADSNSPSGYACEMEILDGAQINTASRSRFGYDTNIPTSGALFISIWAKFEGGPISNIVPRVYTGAAWYDLAPLDGGSQYLTSEYRRFGVYAAVGTGSGGPNPGFSMTQNNSNNQTGQKTRWHSPQVELKDHATPFIAGTRSATEALKDFTKNATLDLSNVSFDSNAQMEFDGTDDWLNITITLNAGNFTYETVMKQFGSTSYQIFSAGTGDPSNGGTNVQAFVNSSGGLVNLYAPVGGSGWETGTYDNTGNFTATSNVDYHIVVVNSNTTWKIYVNGELVGDIDSFVPTVGNRVGVARSGMQSANDKSSQVSLTKIYNKALSAEEVQQNFNTIKGRFGI